MLRISNISMPLDVTDEMLRACVLQRLQIKPQALLSLTVARRSVDARDKGDVHFVYTL